MSANLINLFECQICLEDAVRAMLCPKCNKIYCKSCIEDWLNQPAVGCPNCRCKLVASFGARIGRNHDALVLVDCSKLTKNFNDAVVNVEEAELRQQRIIDRLERRVSHLRRVAESLDDELEIYKQAVGHGETLYERYAREFREGRPSPSNRFNPTDEEIAVLEE